MPQANDTVAALLDEYAALTVMSGGDPFRARVYNKASRAVAGYSHDVSQLQSTALLQIAGVGKSIAAKIGEINATGTFAELEEFARGQKPFRQPLPNLLRCSSPTFARWRSICRG